MWAKIWTWIKTYLFKFLGGLFMDEKVGIQVISLGRVLLLVVFTVMLVNWHKERPELPGGLMEVFYVLTGYVFGSKVVGTAREWLANGSSIPIQAPPPASGNKEPQGPGA